MLRRKKELTYLCAAHVKPKTDQQVHSDLRKAHAGFGSRWRTAEKDEKNSSDVQRLEPEPLMEWGFEPCRDIFSTPMSAMN
jgi:hypothetical protein